MKIGYLWCNAGSRFSEASIELKSNIIDAFTRIDPSLQFTTYDLINDQFPKLADQDAFVIGGSRFSVYQDLDWIKKLNDLILTMDQAKKKCIGICFGHQAIATALGGKVEISPTGWGVGVKKNQIYHLEPWMNPTKNEFLTIASHQDQVTQLPKRAKLIAGSDFCANFWISVDRHFTSLQGHPEFSQDFSKLIINGLEVIPKPIKKAGIASHQFKPDSALVNQWLIQFLNY